MGGDTASAKESLLAESWKSLPDYCSGTPARKLPYPFKKALGSNAKDIVKLWQSEKGVVTSLWPDFAIRNPFPHKIVFEGKYADAGISYESAKEILATNIYQGFFYRGLPKSKGERETANYDYDYACVLMGDGTENGVIKKVWASLNEKVRESFWEGANLYVMIL